jgi:hypothetical protein
MFASCPCLPGRGAHVSMNARWSSPPVVFVLGPALTLVQVTFTGRATPDRAERVPEAELKTQNAKLKT